MTEQIAYCVMLFFLGILTTEDIKENKLSARKIMFFAVTGAIYRLLISSFSGRDFLESLIPGGMLILLAVLTGESIGLGDGIVVTVFGLWTGIMFTTITVCTGIIFSGICGFFFWIIGEKRLIPFVPFLLIGMEVSLFYV